LTTVDTVERDKNAICASMSAIIGIFSTLLLQEMLRKYIFSIIDGKIAQFSHDGY